jgi:Flp pilus assembly pilin Flp
MMKMKMRHILAALRRDARGQDLIEYALLCGAIGFACVVGVGFLTGAMNSSYDSWQDAAQEPYLVTPCLGPGGVLETPPCP